MQTLSCSDNWKTISHRYFGEAVSFFDVYFHQHFAYITSVGLVGGAIIFFIEGGRHKFVDTLFMSVSAVTETGLGSIDLSTMNIGSQVMIWLFILMGGVVLFSCIPPMIRRRHILSALRKADVDPDNAGALFVEVSALKSISIIVLVYWFVVQFLGFVLLVIYATQDKSMAAFLSSRDVHPVWFAIFHAVSSFNNAGFTLFTDNLSGLSSDRFVLLVISCEILLGNVLAPPALRFIVWVLHRRDEQNEGLKLLLHNPRMCFTHMFSPQVTKSLIIMVGCFTLIEFSVGLGTDWNEPFFSSKRGSTKALITYFQSVSTRTAGFNVINIYDISEALQFITAVFMFMSAYPLIFSHRRKTRDHHFKKRKSQLPLLNSKSSTENLTIAELTSKLNENVPYGWRKRVVIVEEEATLDAFQVEDPNIPKGILRQIFEILEQELPMLVMATIAILLAEQHKLDYKAPGPWFSIWGIIFEVSSAFGTVGLTLSTAACSLSGFVSTFSKFVFMMLMLVGRHRGLPYNMSPKVDIPKRRSSLVSPKGSSFMSPRSLREQGGDFKDDEDDEHTAFLSCCNFTHASSSDLPLEAEPSSTARNLFPDVSIASKRSRSSDTL